jgi:hypothetical protein
MAGIRKKGDAYYCTFRFQGRRYYFTVGDVPEAQALWNGKEMQQIRREHLGARRSHAPQFAHFAWCYENKYIDFEQVFEESVARYIVRLSERV